MPGTSFGQGNELEIEINMYESTDMMFPLICNFSPKDLNDSPASLPQITVVHCESNQLQNNVFQV